MENKNFMLRKNILWNTIGSIFYLICQWLVTILVVRISGYVAAGIFALAMSIGAIFTMVAFYGMRNFQISDEKEKYKDGIYVISRIITCLIAFVLCGVFTEINNYDFYQKLCIMAFMAFKLTEGIVDVYQGIVQRVWRLDIAGKSLIARGIITVGAFCLVLTRSGNLLLAILAMMIGAAVVIIIYDIPRTNKICNITYKLDLKDIKELLIECFPLVIFGVLPSIITFIPRYFLEKQFGSQSLGIYASISSPTLIVQVFSNLMFTPLYPIFSQSYYANDIKKFKIFMRKCMFFIIAITICSLLGAAVFGKIGLTILFGKDILIYQYLLLPITMCTISTAILWFLGGVLTAIRQLRLLVWITTIGTIICCLIASPIVRSFNMNGVSIAHSVSQLIICVALYVACAIILKRREKEIEG